MPAHLSRTPESPTDDSRRAELQRIIDERDLSIALQPIVHLRTGDIIGHEALTRLSDSSCFKNPGMLFDAAVRLGMLEKLEAVCRRLTLERAASRQGDALLFMNNSPSVISADSFLDELLAATRETGFPPQRLVLEITERTDENDLKGLDHRTHALREHGFEIALDDVGAGISGLSRIMMLRPNWVKLDRSLIAEIDQDPLRQNLLRSLLQFVKLSEMSLIAEGIERYEELAVLVEMGVPFGQGFFLATPSIEEPSVGESVKQCISRVQQRADSRRFEHPSTIRIAALARPVATFDRTASCRTVLEHLSDPGRPDTVVIQDGRRFQSVVDRRCLREALRTLPLEAPIGAVRGFESPPVASDVTLAEALEVVASRDGPVMSEPLVVRDRNGVVGLVSLRGLLNAAADAHRHAPAHLAALTRLPTRVQADQWIASRIRSGHPTNVAFVDLRDFDAYNLTYGFEMGDAMLLRLVGLIKAVIEDGDRGQTLLAHLGEDRFMVAFPDDRRAAFRRLAGDFQAAQGEFFSESDTETRTFTCADPCGGARCHALTTVRVVYLERPLQHVANPRELHEVVQSLRMAPGSELADVVFERRRPAGAQARSA